MCGIAGQLSFSGKPTPKVDLMLRALEHRGPDGVGEWSDDHCSLGQRRLAIIDLSEAGQAPLSNEDGTVWVTFNGEIYNFKELRRDLQAQGHRFRGDSDTEVIVHAYEQWGTASVERFRGMFAFALWDQKRQRLFLARDRVGKKPLFYANVDGEFYFASELQSLLAVSSLTREVDVAGIESYLSWGYIPAPRTGFARIRKLLPGHWMSVELGAQGKERTQCYWSLQYSPKTEVSEEEAAARLRDVLTEAVRLRMISDVPLGAFLSGGMDSSIIVGLMAQFSSTPVKTFSIGFEEESYDELTHARRVATRWGTDHHEHVVKPDAMQILPLLARHYGEPFADSSAIPTFYVSQLTRQIVTVALNGDGGDESFAGYDRYWAAGLAERIQRLPGLGLAATVAGRLAAPDPKASMRRVVRFLEAAGRSQPDRYSRWMSYFTPEDKARLCDPEFVVSSSAISPAAWFEELFAETDATDPAEVAMSADVRSYLPYDLLVKVDIASMSNSLEARSPFLDHEVMELAARLPVSMKLRGRNGKRILKTAFADLLPEENVNRRKMGFAVPVGTWFRGTLRDFVRDCLLSEDALGRGYFVETELRRVIEDHQQGRTDNGAKLWNLLMLEMWHREVVDASAEVVL